jgi:hypothetical protein
MERITHAPPPPGTPPPPHAHHFHVRPHFGGVCLRQDHSAEPEDGRLARADIGLRHAADLAEESDFGEDDGVMRNGHTFLR